MEQYKKEFIDFMLESKVLKFGDFTREFDNPFHN